MRKLLRLLTLLPLLLAGGGAFAQAPLVLMTDFGVKDGAVAEVKGVAYQVSPSLVITDLTHEVPAGDIFTGAYRLFQVENYWPKGSVFVTVVDPGVGTSRLSIVLKTKTGQYFVGPDNGLYTLIAERDGIDEIRQIDERSNRFHDSQDSHTFHGRDVYGYTGARLAAGVISFEQVGPKLPDSALVVIPYQHPAKVGDKVTGIIPVLDIQYGNVWTNIPKSLFDQLNPKYGDKIRFKFFHGGKLVHEAVAPYSRTFGDVPVGQPVAYVNSLFCVSLALNLGDYAAANKIEAGADWTVEVSKA